MRAFADSQTSGNNWSPVEAGGMLHQEQQRVPTFPQVTGRSFFDALEKQMLDFTVQHQAMLADVRRHFVLPPDPNPVTSFLSAHRAIPQILLEAMGPLRTCFGADAVFHLRTLTDESGSQTLYAVVMWPGSLRDVRAGLARFDDDWWTAHSHQASGHLTFTYELI